MIDVPQSIIDMVNAPNRMGVLCTVDPDGKPNVAYFGSPRFRSDKTLSLGLMGGRTLNNLKSNPNAVFFCIESSPVTFTTPACRIYLEVQKIETEGELLDQIRVEVAEHVNADAAKMISSAIAFNVTEIRNLVDM
ncbi:pyridoxamine 5'-phosphate oxidase family protein [bacterium]|nr:pyridoxamine 5'-phosphate oxidase family protein [bacterium]